MVNKVEIEPFSTWTYPFLLFSAYLGSSLQCIHSSCDTIHLSVMSPVRNYVREILQNTAHSSYCINGYVSSLHHIEFESLSIIFIILFSSSFFKCLALWSSAPINKSAHQLYKVSHEGKLEILIWQITFCINDIKYTISHACQPTL